MVTSTGPWRTTRERCRTSGSSWMTPDGVCIPSAQWR
jgi:hypothetical protein